MVELLTAKEIQVLLQIDRSTIYRLAEAGQIPALKIGKQWRFPRDQFQNWLKVPSHTVSATSQPNPSEVGHNSTSAWPLDCCIQRIQDTFAEALGVMLLVTDLTGQPITRVSRPCPIYTLITETDSGRALYRQKWQELGQLLALEPAFEPGPAALLQARALIRRDNELKAMVIISGIAAADWPPPSTVTNELVRSIQIASDKVQKALASVVSRTPAQQKQLLLVIQRMATILTCITNEQFKLRDRLDNIAKLSFF